MALEGRSLAIFLVSIVMMSLSLAIVSLRTFVRLCIVRAFGWDDASMIAALVRPYKDSDLICFSLLLVPFHALGLLLYRWIDERHRSHIYRLYKCRHL